MATARAHHFVPKVLLRGFADETDRVWVWRRRTQRWVRQQIGEVAHERDFYLAEGEAEARLEHWLDREFETPAGEALKRLRQICLGKATLTEYRGTIDRFVAAQLARTPAFRKFWARQKASWIPDLVDEALNEAMTLAAQRGIPIPADARSRIQAGADGTLTRNGDLDTMIRAIESAGHGLARKPCHVIVAPLGTDFVCSDDPVKVVQEVHTADGRVLPRILAHQGLGRPDTILWLPISHCVGLWFGPLRVEVDGSVVRTLNATVMLNAEMIIQRWPEKDRTLNPLSAIHGRLLP